MTPSEDSSAPGGAPRVQTARTRAERDRVMRFVYDVYVEEMGKRFAYADHERRVLRDGLDDAATLLYIAEGEEVMAALRLVWGAEGAFPDAARRMYALERFEPFPPTALSISSRLAVAPKQRGTAILGHLLLEAYRLGRERGVQFNFCHCAPSLVQLYEQLGYRRYAESFEDPDTGLRIPMVLVAEDLDDLRAVRSPLARVARHMKNDPAAGQWFAGEFAGRFGAVQERLMSEEDLWRFLTERLHRDDIPLFQGLADEEVTGFLKAGAGLRCRRGGRIIRTGDVGEEMFLLLSGAVEVEYTAAGDPRHLATLGKGQIFGEMAYLSKMPRTADVVALSDLELLIINQNFLRKVMARTPEVATKVLFNLALVLCERLRATTRGWAAAVSAPRLRLEETP